MIWVVFLILLLGTALLLSPAFFSEADASDAESDSYFAQIDALDARDDLSDADRAGARLQLERQILARKDAAAGRPSTTAMIAVLSLLGAGALLTYLPVGRPDLTRPQTVDASDPVALIEELERRLATDRADDPAGWRIYANILMQSGRYAEGAQALERIAALGESSPELTAQIERARALAAQQEAMAGMTEDGRAAMIQGMVDGLAARLAENPDDPQGWVRLLRSRQVLEQPDQLRADITAMQAAFADRPEVAARILEEAGLPATNRNNP